MIPTTRFSILASCSPCPHSSVSVDRVMCAALPGPVEMFRDGFACPEGRFVVGQQPSFAKPVGVAHPGPIPRPSLVEKVTSLARSVASGRASDEVVAERNRQCNACEKLVRDGEKRYCGACGCPRTPMSELSWKLTRAHLVCPRKRPGFSNYEAPR